MTRTRLGRVGLTLVLVASGGLAVADGADAANCGKAKERYHVLEYDTEPRYVGEEKVSGPGGKVEETLKETTTFTMTIEAQWGAEAKAEAKQVWAGISWQFKGAATWSKTTERGYRYEHEIPDGRWGHLMFWNEIWKTKWVRYIDFERCPNEWVEQGVANVVANRGGYYYWDTPTAHGGPPPYESRHHDGGQPPGDGGGGTPT